MTAALVSIRNLHLHFNTYAGKAYALNGVELEIGQNDFMGLVGETGCGKSITSFAILNLIPAGGEISAGEVFFQGENLLKKSEKQMQAIRGKQIAMVSQDPSAYLNPLFTVGQQLSMVIKQHQAYAKAERFEKACELLATVELPNPQRIMKSYPHELSGGMKQRVAIALALSCSPDLLIADEPTTDLDVTIQAQILDLLQRLRQTNNITILMVTHDLAVVAETCQRVTVLYAGRTVETGNVEEVIYDPKHPYTQALLLASPNPDGRGEKLIRIPGRLPSTYSPLPGCAFHPRCPHAMQICKTAPPPLQPLGKDRRVACYLHSNQD